MTTTTTETCPMSRAAATRAIESKLTWDVDDSAKEWAFGYREGDFAVLYWLNDRAELLRIIEAQRVGPFAFLCEIQRAGFIASTPAGRVKLGLLAAYLFGGASGGADGAYGRAYRFAIESAGPYVTSVH